MSARAARAEPILISLEAQGALPLGSPQSELFGPGGTIALNARYPLLPQLLLGIELRAGLLLDGDPPEELGLVDPDAGTFELAMAMVRVRPLASSDDPRRTTGLFLELGGGGGVTGELGRIGFQGGIGWGIGLGDTLALAPTLRYLQVVQPESVLSGADARLVMLGVELSFGDRPPQDALEAPLERAVVAAPPDRDRDKIPDRSDKCPDRAEDHDGYQDADGCPESDNDRDGILDTADGCPDAGEDVDEFKDADGCPEPDNDEDAFLDADDQCPNEAEVVNGNKDYDGCPDEGLIVFENDRVVLEERVLFDFERARIKREARPVLRAIVQLKAQHPEWAELRVEGHADARGGDAINQELSERRARNVMDELIKLGIPKRQIKAAGFGATRLRDKREGEEADHRNRRVEFVVVSRGKPDQSLPLPGEVEPVAGEVEDGSSDAKPEPSVPQVVVQPAPAPAPAPPGGAGAAPGASGLAPVGPGQLMPPPPPPPAAGAGAPRTTKSKEARP